MSNAVDIVTVLFNSGDVLDRFVASLVGQQGVQWRLIAVDNASSDGCADRLEALGDPRIVVLRNATNTGFARATNRGLRHALSLGSEFMMLLNNDTAFEPEFLKDLLDARDHHQADVIAPRILYLRDPDHAWYAGGHFNNDWIFKSIHEEADSPDEPDHRIVDFASGCCLGITRAVTDTIDLLDERFFVYWEDTDFCMRLKMEAIPIHYVRGITLLHDSSALTGGPNSQTFIRLFYRGYMQLLMKYFGMVYAGRAALRLIAKHHAHRDNRGRRALPTMAGALVRGYLIALIAPRLPARKFLAAWRRTA
ncbi:glycosyltransferase family 2 protein [Sphingomonas montanisoli]|uniref:Glycosyltransferase family 2 protein n=1 Tax=Sphingomonas montanisoli TaxID=2606412 RepID=A0A5D9BY23_9SPHN|nr:glycosyltransferase family 2 protein [Sphingomonas montanisoli]TZG24173.1 glycosyltransferase family 2 protein [Sphingomonas montanisoli]